MLGRECTESPGSKDALECNVGLEPYSGDHYSPPGTDWETSTANNRFTFGRGH